MAVADICDDHEEIIPQNIIKYKVLFAIAIHVLDEHWLTIYLSHALNYLCADNVNDWSFDCAQVQLSVQSRDRPRSRRCSMR